MVQESSQGEKSGRSPRRGVAGSFHSLGEEPQRSLQKGTCVLEMFLEGKGRGEKGTLKAGQGE